jgi:hypothetical protein
MTSAYFSYNKGKVIQALRFHFISRKEIKVSIVLINVFAILSAVLFYFKKISPFAFLTGSFLWFIMMLLFWFFLPYAVYKRSPAFRDRFRAVLRPGEFTIENDRGEKSWSWSTFSSWIESPHFFHLYFNSRSFFIIPKEAFGDEDLHEARRTFAQKIIKRS